MKRNLGLTTLLLVACLVTAAAAQGPPSGGTALEVKASGPKTFYVDQRAGANQIVIQSESTLEDFTSVANQIGGQFQLDPKNLEAVSGRFFLRVEDIRTGIDLRDRDLRSADWLDAARYPLVTFTVQRAEQVQKKSPNSAAMTLIGTMEMHGVRRDVRIPATLIYLDESPVTLRRTKGDLISVRAQFPVRLSDYNITGPKTTETVGLTVADEQSIRVSIFASSEPPPPPLEQRGQPAAPAATGPATAPAQRGAPALPLPPRPQER